MAHEVEGLAELTAMEPVMGDRLRKALKDRKPVTVHVIDGSSIRCTVEDVTEDGRLVDVTNGESEFTIDVASITMVQKAL